MRTLRKHIGNKKDDNHKEIKPRPWWLRGIKIIPKKDKDTNIFHDSDEFAKLYSVRSRIEGWKKIEKWRKREEYGEKENRRKRRWKRIG